MTGSLMFNRQCSTNVVETQVNKIDRPKLRRCSSADEHNSHEQPTTEIHQYKIPQWRKTEQTSSDIDSGAEDLDPLISSNVGAHIEENVDEESLQSFGGCDDEGYGEVPTQINEEEQRVQLIEHDLLLAATIPHEDKKTFCDDTCITFHAEFARLISLPISLYQPGVRYHLLPFCDYLLQWIPFRYTKVDNAKAQFKCSQCHRSWTSMRARVAFYITEPSVDAVIAVRILSQQCQSCNRPAEALWYMEEVCRVMENLAETMFIMCGLPYQRVSPSNRNDAELIDRWSTPRQSRHDPKQRKGKMNAQHDREHCEACLLGFCFA